MLLRVDSYSGRLSFLHTTVGKASPCSAGDLGSIPRLGSVGSSPGEGNATHSSILAWRIAWTEEPGSLTVHGITRVRHDLVLSFFLSGWS